jgi:hypothetical protein
MHDLPTLVSTLQAAWEAPDDEASVNPDPVLKAICRDVRQWIEALQRVEQADDLAIVEFFEKTFLRRKGILIALFGSGADVRKVLKAKGSTRVSSEGLAGLMESTVCMPEIEAALAALGERIAETTAREVVKGRGLDWPEPPRT